MFDTHCHLNFKTFDDNFDEVVAAANTAGVTNILVPGTDIVTSKKAIAIAQKYKGVYAAVGIHPHHIYEKHQKGVAHESVDEELKELEALLSSSVIASVSEAISNEIATAPDVRREPRNDIQKKIAAIGEIGLDRYIYTKTKYGQYEVDEKFIELQKTFLANQLTIAKKYNKSVILHNREAKNDLLPLLSANWDSFFEERMLLHCCEPDRELLEFAKAHKMFIGVDGDITYYPEKKEFIKTVPLEMLVLETDSPFLIPEPLKSQKVFPNEPKNLKLIAEFVANVRGESLETLVKQTTENAKRLFNLASTHLQGGI